jgi:hypothetical protein
MLSKVLLICAIATIASAQNTFKDCLEKDSISCIQLAVWNSFNYLCYMLLFGLSRKEKKMNKKVDT